MTVTVDTSEEEQREQEGREEGGKKGESSKEHVQAIIDSLELRDTFTLLYGRSDPVGGSTGYLSGSEQFGIPPMSMVDGPMGIRTLPSTAFPASIALAASWDPALAREFGIALGNETRGAGQDAILAPGMNVVRVPQCGRTFEHYSEDPYLSSQLGVGTIEGIQSTGAMATAKHFLAHSQEENRHHFDVQVSERALREIYMPAFEAAVKDANVSSVMAAYNRINGTHVVEHPRLLTDVLKDEWEFEGFVVSDWWGTMDGPAAANAGLDLDMPGVPIYEWHCYNLPGLNLIDALPDWDWIPKATLGTLALAPYQVSNPNPNVFNETPFGEPLREAVENGHVEESTLDEKLRRILGQMERFGLFDGERPNGSLDAPAHHDLAQRIAERGTVLLQNDDDLLPLEGDESIALVGPDADGAKVGGGGSSEVDPTRATSPLDGLRERVPEDGTVTFERGVPRVGDATILSDVVPDLSLLGTDKADIEDAVAVAADADVAVVVARDAATETEDRALDLPGAQDELITAVASVAERTVVVLNTAGMVTMPWVDDVDAVLQTWYPGQEDGHALASVLFGDVDPSGRLPVTFGHAGSDFPASTTEQYPGVGNTVEYTEGVFVGYRHFDAEAVEPLFPFGHGLSYTDFSYRNVSVDDAAGTEIAVEVTVENVGDRTGRDVVQLYVSPDDPAIDRPPRELAAFEPVELDAGESTTVTLSVDERAFQYYDEAAGDWTVDAGRYDLEVSRSSRDIRERVSIEV